MNVRVDNCMIVMQEAALADVTVEFQLEATMVAICSPEDDRFMPRNAAEAHLWPLLKRRGPKIVTHLSWKAFFNSPLLPAADTQSEICVEGRAFPVMARTVAHGTDVHRLFAEGVGEVPEFLSRIYSSWLEAHRARVMDNL